MNNNQFVISIGDHKKVIYAKILSETKSITCITSMANTHTNRRLVDEKEVSELKNNRNCTVHTYKIKNHKYKTIHKCLVYNFINTQDRLMFMDNLVKFLVTRRFPNVIKLQIFELIRTKTKDAWSISTRTLKENAQAVILPRPKVYRKKKKRTIENNYSSSQLQSSSSNNTKQRTILQIPVPKTHINVMNIKKKKTLLEIKQKKKSLCLQRRALITQSRPITRSITHKNKQSTNLKTNAV